jgi:hypothetical protein
MVDRNRAEIYLSELMREQFRNDSDMAELAMRETFEAETAAYTEIEAH